MDSSEYKQSFARNNAAPTSNLALTSSTPYQLPSQYKGFLNDPTSSDVTIRFGGKRVYAHRAVLCRGSEYFAKMLTGKFQESSSKEIELHGDEPDAIFALLRFLYGLPYDAEANSKWLASLYPHAQVYVAADKYQIEPLKEAIADNMREVISDKNYTHKVGYLQHCNSFKNAGDFYSALKTILEVTTTQDRQARGVLLDFLIQNINFFRKENEFLFLVKDFPELAVELICHEDLESEAEGLWMCIEQDCGINIPSCSKCKFLFEAHFLRRYRYDDLWECPKCRVVDKPACVDCRAEIVWVSDSDCAKAEQESGQGTAMDVDDDSDAAAKASRGHA